MARAKDTALEIAKAMGVPEMRAIQIDRAISAAGLRPAARRGITAHDVGPDYMGMFAVGAMASDTINGTALAIADNRGAAMDIRKAVEAEAASPGIARRSNWSLTIDMPSAGDLKRRSTISWVTIEAAAGLLAREMGK